MWGHPINNSNFVLVYYKKQQVPGDEASVEH